MVVCVVYAYNLTEEGILAQLHKKPLIPRLVSGSSSTNIPNTPPAVSSVSNVVHNTGIPLPSDQGISPAWDHTYASPTPQVRRDVVANPPSRDQNCEQHPSNNDHSYAELSDVPTETYECDSDSQDDIVTTGGKVIISSSDKVEISVEYQCDNSLPEATNEGTGSVATIQMTGSEHQEPSKVTPSEPKNI